MRVPLEAPTTILREHGDISLTDTHTQTDRQCTCDDASPVGSADHHYAGTQRPLTDRHTHTDRQTDRHTQTYIQTDRQTDRQTVYL